MEHLSIVWPGARYTPWTAQNQIAWRLRCATFGSQLAHTRRTDYAASRRSGYLIGRPAPRWGSDPFELSDPVHTPYGLNTSNKIVQLALGDAISLLDQDHIPLNSTLGSVQYVTDHGTHIPIPGGPGDPDGIFNAIYAAGYPDDSQTAPDDGSSFIQVVTWNDTACPVGATILTYSESSNPASPHYTDQTRLFSRKQWLPDRFCPAQILADPQLQVTRLTG